MRVAVRQEKWNYIKASGLSYGDVTEIEKTEDGKPKVVETFGFNSLVREVGCRALFACFAAF